MLSNHWLETLDYTRQRITLNNHSAVLEPDGTVKVVVAARDPGHPNWLDSAGHARGTIGVRWVGKGVADVVPSARVIRPAQRNAPHAGLAPGLDSGYLTVRQIDQEPP